MSLSAHEHQMLAQIARNTQTIASSLKALERSQFMNPEPAPETEANVPEVAGLVEQVEGVLLDVGDEDINAHARAAIGAVAGWLEASWAIEPEDGEAAKVFASLIRSQLAKEPTP